MDDKVLPYNFIVVLLIIIYFKAFQKYLPKDFVYVDEGANTMGVGRTLIKHDISRRKLDSGTFGTMGIRLPLCNCIQIVLRERQILAILGDSAIGFSKFEFEKSTIYSLPLSITALNPNSRYEKLSKSFGGKGHSSMKEVLSNPKQNYIYNVKINPYGQKRPQEHAFLTQSQL